MKLGHVIVPAAGLEAQIEFYTGLGLELLFRDGDRYAAVSDGRTTLGLAGLGEQPVEGQVTVSVQVEDLDACCAELARGGAQVGDVVTGPHERRVVVVDAGGNPLVVHERLP